MTDATHPATAFLAGLIDHDFDRVHAGLASDATRSVLGDTAISDVARARTPCSSVPGLEASFEAGR